MLADDLLEDARHLKARATRKRDPRACAVRFRRLTSLARMFNHQKMRDAPFTPRDKKNPTPVEIELVNIITAFGQLQKDRHRADYDLGWNIVETDVADAITLAEDTSLSGGRSGLKV